MRSTLAVRTVIAGLVATGSGACGGEGAPSLPDAGRDPDASVATDAAESRLAEATIGASGGMVMTSTGVKVEIPEGALPGDVTITIDEVSDVPPPPDATVLGATIQLGPEGQTFAAPVKVTLPWTGGDVPVVIAHRPATGTWTTLDYAGDHDETHVWGYTDSFSPFVPVYYQGSPDAPIVLRNDRPVSPIAVGRNATDEVNLFGSGFRTDTVVTLFKDGVATATATNVALTHYGLRFSIPAAFTATVGVLTIQAKNPAAAMGDATPLYVIATPVLGSLSPSAISVIENSDVNSPSHYVPAGSGVISVTANDLPANVIDLCSVAFEVCFSRACAPGHASAPALSGTGFNFSVLGSQLTGPHDVVLRCGSVSSNKLSLNLVGPPP